MGQRFEEQIMVDGLKLFEDPDGSGDGFANPPARFDAVDVLPFERSAVDPPSVGFTVAISLGLYASPPQVFDFAVPRPGQVGDDGVAGDLQHPSQDSQTVVVAVVAGDSLDPR